MPRKQSETARCVFLTLGLLALAFEDSCQGQFAPGDSTTGIELAEKIKASRIAEPEMPNIRLGPANLAFSAGLRQEYNDNITISDQSQQDDLIMSPHVATHIYWPISQLNKLDLVVDLSYQKYINHSALDTKSLLVLPGSMMNFDFFVKDIHFNIHDRISIQQDPATTTQLSNVGIFRRTDNTAGIDAEWDLNKILLSAGFDYNTLKCSDQEFKFLDMTTGAFHGRVGYRATSPLILGVTGSFMHTEYDEQVQNNSDIWSAGVFGDMIFSEYLRGELEVDYEATKYENGGTIGDNSQFDSMAFSGKLMNQLNQWCTHSAQIRRYITPGVGTNFTEIYELDYDATLDIIKDIATSIGGFVESFKDSGSQSVTQDNLSQGGQPGEKGYRYGLRVQMSYQLLKSTRIGAGYQRTEKDSNIDTNGYDQNRFFIDLSHQF